jgi:hypothetical protein
MTAETNRQEGLPLGLDYDLEIWYTYRDHGSSSAVVIRMGIETIYILSSRWL